MSYEDVLCMVVTKLFGQKPSGPLTRAAIFLLVTCLNIVGKFSVLLEFVEARPLFKFCQNLRKLGPLGPSVCVVEWSYACEKVLDILCPRLKKIYRIVFEM